MTFCSCWTCRIDLWSAYTQWYMHGYRQVTHRMRSAVCGRESTSHSVPQCNTCPSLAFAPLFSLSPQFYWPILQAGNLKFPAIFATFSNSSASLFPQTQTQFFTCLRYFEESKRPTRKCWRKHHTHTLNTHTLSHTLTHTHSLSHTLSRTHTLTHTFSHTLTNTHTHRHTHTHTHKHTLSHTRSHTLTHTLTHTHTHTHTLSHTLSVMHGEGPWALHHASFDHSALLRVRRLRSSPMTFTYLFLHGPHWTCPPSPAFPHIAPLHIHSSVPCPPPPWSEHCRFVKFVRHVSRVSCLVSLPMEPQFTFTRIAMKWNSTKMSWHSMWGREQHRKGGLFVQTHFVWDPFQLRSFSKVLPVHNPYTCTPLMQLPYFGRVHRYETEKIDTVWKTKLRSLWALINLDDFSMRGGTPEV